MKVFVGYVAKWIGFLALWLVFVYQVTMPELLVGAAASALTLFALEYSFQVQPLQFRPRIRWIAELWRMPAMIVEDLWSLLQNLLQHALRRPSGALFQMTPFHTSGDKSRQSAQRCLATVYMSLPPNSVVVDIDTKTGLIMFHQVKDKPVPSLVRELES